MSSVQTALGDENTKKLQEFIFVKESTGDYQIENQFGYIGGYQFGAEALQSVGLIKPGIETSYGTLGAEGHKALLNDPTNWTINGGKQAYLSNTALQDQAFQNLANSNYTTLARAGVINSNSTPDQIAGYLAAAHLVGAGAVIANPNLTTTDGLGTSGRSYYEGAAGAILGQSVTFPGPNGEALDLQRLRSDPTAYLSAPSRSIAEGRSLKTLTNRTDWRFRVRLSPYSNYLYNAPDAANGILRPLVATDGVVFPYTPKIDIQYFANYEEYKLTHSNHRGFFYQGSIVGDILVNAEFTAQDVTEANYLLAVIHFFRSATKMFYGQDTNPERGAPPPLLYLNGLGEYQFNEHPCALKIFNYNLPNNVDYIRCGGIGTQTATDFRGPRSDTRLSNWWSNILAGNSSTVQDATNATAIPATQIVGGETYVPTKITLALTFHPVQTRRQISKEFSLRNYANGSLVKKGFW